MEHVETESIRHSEVRFESSVPSSDTPVTRLVISSSAGDEARERLVVTLKPRMLEVEHHGAEHEMNMRVEEREQGVYAVAETHHGTLELPISSRPRDEVTIDEVRRHFTAARSMAMAAPSPSLLAMASALEAWRARPPSVPPTVVAAAAKTKEQCDKDLERDLEDAGADAGLGAVAGATACAAGPLGCLAGLAIVGWTYVKVDNDVERAQEKHEECVDNAGRA